MDGDDDDDESGDNCTAVERATEKGNNKFIKGIPAVANFRKRETKQHSATVNMFESVKRSAAMSG